MGRKIKEPILSDRGELTWKLLNETTTSELTQLIDLYRKDKHKARVLYFSKSSSIYYSMREVLFEFENGDFKICKFKTKYGISKSGIMYHREVLEYSFLYVKKKFYYKAKNTLTIPTHSFIKHFENHFSSHSKDYLRDRFTWMRNLLEAKYSYPTSLNSIVTKQLFNEKKLLRNIFNLPYPVIKVLLLSNKFNGLSELVRNWRIIKDYLINVENLGDEFYNSPYFDDSCRMARSLGVKVNCSWSLRRLKEEHDSWAKQISNIILETQPLVNLRINEVYVDFAKFSGYELLLTNHDLVHEGIKQNHCVASYIGSVNRGHCGIYKVGDYTLELRCGEHYQMQNPKERVKELYIAQFQGISNVDAPISLAFDVYVMTQNFNKGYEFTDKIEDMSSKGLDFGMDDFFADVGAIAHVRAF